MPNWIKVVGTQTGQWVLGVSGVSLKNSNTANTLDLRNNQDTDYADLRAKEISLNTSLSRLILKQNNLQNSNYTLTFPNTPGTSGQVLSTDGAGNLGWINGSSSSPYNQSLNTSNSVTFASVTTESLTTTGLGTPTFTSGNDIVFSPAGAVNLSNKKIINLATPAQNNDAANKSYVDSRTVSNLANVVGTPVAGDVFYYNGTNWTNFSNYKLGQMVIPATTVLRVANNGTSAYTFTSYTGNNPTIYAISGTTICFDLNGISGTHPFKIQDNLALDYNTGLIHVDNSGLISNDASAQGKSSGYLYWQIPASLSGNYQYICGFHSTMTGAITIKNIAGI